MRTVWNRQWCEPIVWRMIGFLCATSFALECTAAEPGEGKAQNAQPRQLTVLDQISSEPLFADAAQTLDPMDMARVAWKGYLSQMSGTWGRTADLQPMFRMYFDDRALPWPSIKQHDVDGFDVNTRNIGAHAMLHAMLGAEKRNDPAEAGQLAYVLSLTPGGAGSMVVHGEIAENLLLLYEKTGDKRYRLWAEMVIRELKPPVDSADPMGGWLHLQVGWNIGALSRWYALSGERESLNLAVACADRVCSSRDVNGDDGAFRPDGSFGGKSQSTTASWHMHGHTHILPGFIILGEQLLEDGQESKGLAMIERAKCSFDWLYDPEHNPDAGSLTGWLGEWLMVATGWNRQSDCEGCTMGDMVEVAVALGAASRTHPSLVDLASYYDRAEQIYRGQVAASVFRPTTPYLKCVRNCLEQRVAKAPLGAVVWQDQSERGNHAELAAGDAHQIRIATGNSDSPAAIQFADNARFKFRDSAPLRLPRLSVYAVVRTVGDDAQSIYSNYDNPINWGKGVNFGFAPDRRVTFFTTDGTERHYDSLTSSAPVEDGLHIVAATYDARRKAIFIDGAEVANGPAKGLDYGSTSVATIGALREFGQQFDGDLSELIVSEEVAGADRAAIERYLSKKYDIAVAARESNSTDFVLPVLWFQADEGFKRERPEPTSEERAVEVGRLYEEAIVTAGRMEGRLLGLCGFGDWVNKLPSTLDPALPGIDMMGCCSDAVIRAAHAIWSETVTGDADETRVNLAFNRISPLVDVVSCLPHRGEVNVIVKDARRVLVRIPEWAPRDRVDMYVDRQPAPVEWLDSYVVFAEVKCGQRLTVTYPLRIAEVRETVGSLDGTEYTETWRGNTIVDISPRGKLLPTFIRPELNSSELPSDATAAAEAGDQP